MSGCADCRRGTAIPPGQPIPAGWVTVGLIERQSGPAIGIYACPACVRDVPRLARAAAEMT